MWRQREEAAAILTNEEALDLWDRYGNYAQTMTIAVFMTGMIEKLKAWNPPVELGTKGRHVIKTKADIHGTGEMTLHSLNDFFEQIWCQHEDLLAEG